MKQHSKLRPTNPLHARKASRVTFMTSLACAGMVFYWPSQAITASEAATRFAGPISSQPLALTADDAFLAVANPDNNSVSFFDVRGDKNRKLAEVPVQIVHVLLAERVAVHFDRGVFGDRHGGRSWILGRRLVAARAA